MTSINFTVVIPLYNKGRYLNRAIDSVLNQTYRNFELIIVDDGSTDDSSSIVREYKDSRIVFIQQPNAGVASARNRGIRGASGDVIAFLDADDEWKPGYLNSIAQLIRKAPTAGLYVTAYEIVLPNGRVTIPHFEHLPNPPWSGIVPNYFRTAAHGAPPVSASTVSIRKSVFDDVGVFSVGKRMGEDIDMWGRIALKYPVAFSWDVGAVYFQNTQDNACSYFRDEDQHPFIVTGSLHLRNFAPSAAQTDLLAYLDRLKLENARQFVLAGKYDKARGISRSCAGRHFLIKKLIWGSRLNRLTHWVWNIRNLAARHAQVWAITRSDH